MEKTLSKPIFPPFSTSSLISSKSASAKAIKPDYYDAKGNLVTALDLCNYENGGNKNYVISEKNLFLNVDADGELRVTFPTKAYLNYEVALAAGNSVDTFGFDTGAEGLSFG